jgi:hypothetical protein
MADCKNEIIIEKVLTDPEGINPNNNDQAYGNPDGRAGTRVPITNDSDRRRQIG